MKTYLPLIYGIAVSSAVVYYVSAVQPNKGLVDEQQKEPQETTVEQQDAPSPIAKNTATSPEEKESEKKKPSIRIPALENPIHLSKAVDKINTVSPKLITNSSDIIPADDKVIYGSLINGMNYIILKNDQPEGRVSMRLHVGAGSLNEAEDQRGIAHFLEHMVFNGTKNFPDSKKLIPKMQRLGIAFGAHANAYTSFDETVYMLDLPNSEKDTLNLAFDVMQDFAGGALFEKHEIEEERGVISAEKTSRDSVQSRILKQQFKEILPESLVANRFPIGTEEVIQNVKRDRFVSFYTRHYRPKNMCFVFVGDFSSAEAETRINETFGKLTEPPNPGQAPDVGKITTGKGFQTAVFTDKELTKTELSLTTVRRKRPKADSSSNRSQKLPLLLANSILSKRFSKLILEDPETPILSGNAGRNVYFKQLEFGSVDVTAKENDWKSAIPILVREYKRAIEHGFTAAELREAKANIINSYENRVKSASSRKTPDLASSLVANYHNNTVYSTPETDLKIIEEAIGNLTTEMCHQAFLKFWNTKDLHLTLTTSTASDEDEAVLASLFRNESVKETDAPKIEKEKVFGYAKLGKPGKIVNTIQVPDLAITQLILNNGIRVNYKKTDFLANSIQMQAAFGGGKLSEPKDKAGIEELANGVVNMGGLGKHSMQDLQSILAGKSVGVGFGIKEDAFILSGSTTKEDLKLQLQLLTASIKDPGFRPEGERLFKSQLPQVYKSLKHTVQGGSNKVTKTLAGNDPRFSFPEEGILEALSTEDVKAWISPQLKKSYMEVSIVGDFDETNLKNLITRTLGTLPKRETAPQDFSANTEVPETKLPLKETFTFDSKVPSAMAVVAWKCKKYGEDIGELRRLNILSSIFTDRLRIKLREELGQAYSPGAYANISRNFKNRSYIYANCAGKPEDIEQIGTTIQELAALVSSKGITQDELTRALTPIQSSLEKSLKDNGYWLNTVMSQSQLKPESLSWCRERDNDYASINLKEINALAKKYMGKENSGVFVIKPEQE